MPRSLLRSLSGVAALALVLALPGVSSATHSWGGYHWARTSPSFTLKLGDNLSTAWDQYLGTTSTDWSKSTVLDTTIVPGGSRSAKLCNATAGQVQVCNSKYGNTGWLGVASVWVSGLHITQGTVKLNDTYFNTARYNDPTWRNLVSCQEVGHTLGLDHQDTIFDNQNLGTCMDYTNNPAGPPDNQHPNQHDYDELVTIYAHLDSSTTVRQSTASSAASGVVRSEWGREVMRSQGGRTSTFVRDLGAGNSVVTFVIWAN